MDLALNNLQRLICHKTQPTNKFNNIQTIVKGCIRGVVANLPDCDIAKFGE